MPASSAAHVRRVHAVVDARDEGRCRRCGRLVGEWWSRQHRIPRARVCTGGSAVEPGDGWVLLDDEGGVTLCGQPRREVTG